MKRTVKSVFLLVLLAFLLCLAGAAAATEVEPKVGQMAGNVKFAGTMSPEDQKYLGLDKPGEFTLKDVKAPYVLVESFNTT